MGVRKLSIVFTTVVFLGLIAFSFAEAKGIPIGVFKAAQQALKEFPMIKAELSRESKTSSAKISLGEFFRIYTVNPVELVEAKEAQRSFSSFIIPTFTWRVLVIVNGKPHSLLTIDKVDGEWKAVAWGAKELAKELFQLRKEWPSREYSLRFVRIYQARADVVQVVDREGKEKGYVPLISARVALNLSPEFDPVFTLSGKELLMDIRGVVKKELEFRK